MNRDQLADQWHHWNELYFTACKSGQRKAAKEAACMREQFQQQINTLDIETEESTMEIQIILHDEHIPIEGNAVDSGDTDFDAKVNAGIIERLDMGQLWAWCTVEVKVTIDGFTANDYLGCCSYDNEQEFKAGGYYDDMVETCKNDIVEQRHENKREKISKHFQGTIESIIKSDMSREDKKAARKANLKQFIGQSLELAVEKLEGQTS